MSSQSTSRAYAHGHSTETVKAHSQRTVKTSAQFVIPYLKPGSAVIDIGCGPGSITKGFAELVRPGRVVGVDSSEVAIQTAKDLFLPSAKADGLDLSYTVGDLFSLPYPDDTFDVVYTHQVLLHVQFDKVPQALKEMKRICKVGGVIAIRDGKPDRGGHAIFPWNAALERTINGFMQRTYSTGSVEQQAGHFLAIAQSVRFERVSRQFTHDVYDGEERRHIWGSQWEKRSSEESFRKYMLDNQLSTEEELDEIPKAWKEWTENEDGWASMFTLEHLFWK